MTDLELRTLEREPWDGTYEHAARVTRARLRAGQTPDFLVPIMVTSNQCVASASAILERKVGLRLLVHQGEGSHLPAGYSPWVVPFVDITYCPLTQFDPLSLDLFRHSPKRHAVTFNNVLSNVPRDFVLTLSHYPRPGAILWEDPLTDDFQFMETRWYGQARLHELEADAGS